jgi:hypothetical protein
MREKALRYSSVECDVEATWRRIKASKKVVIADFPFSEGHGGLDVSTPFRRSLGSAMAGGFTSYSIAALQRCSILRFELVFQVHPD